MQNLFLLIIFSDDGVAYPHPIFVQCPVSSERLRSCLLGVGRSAVTSQAEVGSVIFGTPPSYHGKDANPLRSFHSWGRPSGFRVRAGSCCIVSLISIAPYPTHGAVHDRFVTAIATVSHPDVSQAGQ